VSRVFPARPHSRILTALAVAVLATLGSTPSRASAQRMDHYAVATLAPSEITVPPVVMDEVALHALLVELRDGISREVAARRLGLDAAALDRLYGLAEVHALGRQTEEGGWKPLAFVLDAAGADRLTAFTDTLSMALADSLERRWSWIDSLTSLLPLSGRLPLAQSGHILLGGYMLANYQADAFWQAGLAPSDRTWAFRVYRVPADRAPLGHRLRTLGDGGWILDRFARDPSDAGLARLLDPDDPVVAGLATSVEELGRLREQTLLAYRAWYLLDRVPDLPTRLVLERLGAVDSEGRLRVPLIGVADESAMRSIAGQLAEMLWPVLKDALPAVGRLAGELGYGDPRLLGEVTLWTWERAAQGAVERLIERGLLLAAPDGASQAIRLPPRH